MQRTPPTSKNSTPYNSEAEQSKAAEVAGKKKNLPSKRQKRRRGSQEEGSNKDDEYSLKEEILAMLEEWKCEQQTTLNKLMEDVKKVKQQNEVIQKTNNEIRNSSAEIEKTLSFLSQKYEDLRSTVAELEKEKKETLIHVRALEDQIDDMQRHLRSTMIEIRNVPKLETETKHDLMKIVKDTCDALSVPLQTTEIKEVFRVNSKQGPKKSSLIVVDFTTTKIKEGLLRNMKEFNKKNMNNKFNSRNIGFTGPTLPLYISESLTQKASKLFYKSRTFAKDNSYKYCWIRNGRVYLRKADKAQHILIKDENQLQLLSETS